MRIYKRKYYILWKTPGLSGFRQWDKREYRVCTGYKASLNKTHVVKEFLANGRGVFRLEDGHLPDYQPVVKEKEIYDFLDNEPYQTVFIVNPEVYGLKTEM